MSTIDRTVPHVNYMDSRYMYTDEDGNDVRTEERPVMCGAWDIGLGGNVFCDPCTKDRERQYPQGWRHYPGDVCPHGKYTGGSGVDWMCGPCEMGDDE